MNNQIHTPLLDQLLIHNKKQPVSFHVPGHKYGELFPGKGREFYQSLLKLDATELTDLDDLHSPEGVILKAQQLLSNLYQTSTSFFLVNGSTSGNLAMILATIEEDDIVLVQRNSHKSIMNGIRLANAQPIYLNPEYDSELMVASGVSLETIKAAIQSNPNAKALILTYPNYYGMVYNLKGIIELAHEHGIPVLVDEAHGVHFVVGDPFPPSAVSLGADVVVQSAHKTLPAMTMGAYLHFNSSIVSLEKLSEYLQVVQSSSPSYPIMASLDVARSYLGTFTKEDIQSLVKRINAFKTELERIDGLTVYSQSKQDPLKLVLRANGYSGFELQEIFERQGIFAELADPNNLLMVLPLYNEESTNGLIEAVAKIKEAMQGASSSSKHLEPTRLPKFEGQLVERLALSFKEMSKKERNFTSLSQAVGKICAESIIPYPPGIPLVLPGERVKKEHIKSLEYLLKIGAKIQGGERLKAGELKIFK
ncbi:aminotransferase class I/II-fold pyridoxal phosphate-dependent enzyme [Mesobacillus maritimus]|uniref:Aminotransferase class I/II-fold pyridoxal phosphate-dependent enzyme n=1 Tax=Mesobacillus maritimus TaxID=1643336 RepID=A0ABS7JZS5_9BACI|nr:aminotransferase class I/II-fold pyridoxal phosphate-dependent enzyme [Mesobacillus maritimus]MBY0095502.1 aminotransferase class I/II-fold pyridoxal phosphate-dependent enzyme [Mesobacillus maritimus]